MLSNAKVRHTSNTLSTLLVPHASRSASEEHRTVKYASRYRLAFTLLNEDAASGQGVFTWDVREAIDGTYALLDAPRCVDSAILDYLKSSLSRLSILHNFTIESQVQFHAPLAFQPRAITVQGHEAHGLTPEDLTVFVNSAEWTLCESAQRIARAKILTALKRLACRTTLFYISFCSYHRRLTVRCISSTVKVSIPCFVSCLPAE